MKVYIYTEFQLEIYTNIYKYIQMKKLTSLKQPLLYKENFIMTSVYKEG